MIVPKPGFAMVCLKLGYPFKHPPLNQDVPFKHCHLWGMPIFRHTHFEPNHHQIKENICRKPFLVFPIKYWVYSLVYICLIFLMLNQFDQHSTTHHCSHVLYTFVYTIFLLDLRCLAILSQPCPSEIDHQAQHCWASNHQSVAFATYRRRQIQQISAVFGAASAGTSWQP